MLTNKELERYNRQIILPGIGIKGQEKIKKAKILVIGAGGLGSPVLLYLSGAGVGNIGIIDNDIVEETNLQRQILYSTNEIGQKKIDIAKQKLQSLNPNIKFDIYDQKLDNDNANKIINKYDIIIDCPDNFETRYICSDTCSELNKIHVFGSIFKYEGQVSVFNYNNGPTYRTLFPDKGKPPKNIDKGVFGILPGIIGSMQANEALKIITGVGEVLSGKLLIINTLTYLTTIVKI